MATVFSSADINGLKRTHFSQLLSYIENYESNNNNWRDKKLIRKRHYELKEWIEGIYDHTCDPNNIIPKKDTIKYHNRLYIKVGKTETIKKGAIYSLYGGKLKPVYHQPGIIAGSTPDCYLIEICFYNPI